ncbi:hypothetical protein KKI24_23870 [bacterium]|nr:hypothetical protein [bacterium]
MDKMNARIDSPFFTSIDPKVAIKGSRDPLGFQPIWIRFGRRLVGNVTNVTNSIRQFTTLILGFYFVRDLVERRRLGEEAFMEAFLRFEQLVDYSRYAWRQTYRADSGDIRGIRRVKANYEESPDKLEISADQRYQIMSNQKTYGIWGLFTVSGRDSDLIDKHVLKPSIKASQFIEGHYLQSIEQAGVRAEIEMFLSKPHSTFAPSGKDTKLAKVLAEVHKAEYSSAEKTFYGHHLISGKTIHQDERQERLWKTMVAALGDGDGWRQWLSLAELGIIKETAKHNGDSTVANELDRIIRLEHILSPCARLFAYLQGQHSLALDSIVRDVKQVWPGGLRHIKPGSFDDLSPDIGGASTIKITERLQQLARGLYKGDYETCIRLLIEQNEEVMEWRGGGPWMKLDESGQLEVRYRYEDTALPESNIIADLRTHAYFLDSLKVLGRTLYFDTPEEIVDDAA